MHNAEICNYNERTSHVYFEREGKFHNPHSTGTSAAQFGLSGCQVRTENICFIPILLTSLCLTLGVMECLADCSICCIHTLIAIRTPVTVTKMPASVRTGACILYYGYVPLALLLAERPFSIENISLSHPVWLQSKPGEGGV